MSARIADLFTASNIAAAVVVFILSWYLVHLIDTLFLSPLNAIPGSKRELAIPLFNFAQTAKGRGNLRLREAHDQYGAIVRVAPDRISIADPEALNDFLKTNVLPKHKQTYEAVQHNGEAENIVGTRDPIFHKRVRRLLSPAFSIKYLANLEPQILEIYNILEKKIYAAPKDKNGFLTLDIFQELHYFASDVIGITAFGESFHLIENGQHPFPHAVRQWIQLLAIKTLLPVGRQLFDTYISGRSFQTQVAHIEHCISERRAQNERNETRTDILQWTLDQGKAGNLDEAEIKAMARAMLGAGSETTANTMAWGFAFLLQHREVLQKLRKELDEAFPDSGQPISLDKLKRLPYLDAVLHETLRLRSIASQIWREFPQDTDVVVRGKDGNPKSYRIPAGTMAYFSIYTSQTSSKVWLRGDEFYPERWLSESGEAIKEEEAYQYEDAGKLDEAQEAHWGKPVLCNKSAFMPFSLGARDCIGKNFAWNEMRVVYGHIIRRFDLEAGFDVTQSIPGADYMTWQIARPDGLPVKMRPRTA
ncbi:cytochrome P450 [Gonapodya prolifera JEL478]|uniref:Cytochrome P450 n=1 Tax=Gonapodya prolifera (strain JEL478) TaxID=1344416 RepID=A0A139A3S6_GONPJ|nr:cytochrome P450 [Gonapodya prolifera JEL478]|eukprot:KXS11319.1 cytochrome P450 [Gonapodya prolifera JEL478]